MTKTFNMQFIRYINIFSRVTGVPAKHCFAYNNMIVFIIPGFALERAIGRDNSNLKKLSEIIGKRIRVVAEPSNIKEIHRFIEILAAPIQFEKVEVNNETKEATITTSGMESKAMLIGRGRARETELREILEQYFKIKTLRIV
jgi:NusA-like KH domain protein